MLFRSTKHNIQIEKSTFNTITILLTIGATYSRINRLYLALENIERHSGNRKGNGDKILKDFKLELSPLKYRPRFAFYSDDEMVSLQDALNRISTRMVTPYPPGIPLLVPGQIITKEIINALQMYRNYGVEIHGMDSGMVKVMTAEAEQKLKDEGIGLMH